MKRMMNPALALLLTGAIHEQAAAQTSAAPAPPPASAVVLTPKQLASFGEIVGNARTTIYGEDSHGMLQIHELVPQVFRYLVEKKGYRVFVFEVQWGITEGFADFMASDRTELTAIESYWLNGAFASKPIAAMMVWIRAWNRAHPTDQIQISGYQPEQPVTDFAALLTYLDATLPSRKASLRAGIAPCRAADITAYKTELDFLTANSKFLKQGKPAFTPNEREACLSGLDAIKHSLPNVDGAAAQLARLHLFSLQSYYSILRKTVDDYFANPNASIAEQRAQQNFAYNNGDAARYVIYRKLQALRFPKSKVFHWMHNWHGLKRASETDGIGGSGGAGIPAGTVSFGERLYRDEGAKSRNFLTIVPCGAACKEPAHSLEPKFAAAFGDALTIVSTHDRATRRRLKMNSPGDLFANHHQFGFSNVVLDRQADGVVYLPRSDVAR